MERYENIEALYQKFKDEGDEAFAEFSELKKTKNGNAVEAAEECRKAMSSEEWDDYIAYLGRATKSGGNALNPKVYLHVKKWLGIFSECEDYGDPEGLEAIIWQVRGLLKLSCAF